MDKNEFDMDFDFEKEFGLDLDDLGSDAGLDFSDDFTAQLGEDVDDGFSFDMDNLDLNAYLPDDDDEPEAETELDAFDDAPAAGGDDLLSDLEFDLDSLLADGSDDSAYSVGLPEDMPETIPEEPEDDNGGMTEVGATGEEDSVEDILSGVDDEDFLLGIQELDDADLYEQEGGDAEEEEPEADYSEDEYSAGEPEEEVTEVEEDEDPDWIRQARPIRTSVNVNAPGLSSEEDAPEFEEEEQPRKAKRKKSGLKLPAISLGKKKKRNGKAAAEDSGEASETEETGNSKRRRRPKSDKPSIVSRVLDLYLGPITHRGQEEETELSDKPRRRRRRTKMDIFKEVYLPPLIALCALLVVLTFIVGSVSNAFKQKSINDEKRRRESLAASMAADEAQTSYDQALEQAENLAANYDFGEAISLLESVMAYDTVHTEELIAKKAEYVKAQSELVEWKDISQIPNLSFHVLIADPARAFADKELGGLYNRNFVTVDEFARILKELYVNDFILVDFDTLVQFNTGLDGKKSFFTGGLYLPQGKTPIMITETMVNYFEYMIDSNKDGSPDAGGHGFASKLVVDTNGDIKAQMVDASGNTVVGDYDLVPVLESFIAEHPDFSFKGSRATLAVSGSEGVFGYRTNTSYISSRGQAFYDQEVAEARVLVQMLREKGYDIACYTYGNVDYRKMTVAQIQADQQNWASQILPVIGESEILVYAREGDIDDYTGNKFTQLYNTGYRYFVTNGENPTTDVKESFVRQSRLMVTGNAMGWYSSRFAKYFDSNKVLDMTSRKSIPN